MCELLPATLPARFKVLVYGVVIARAVLADQPVGDHV